MIYVFAKDRDTSDRKMGRDPRKVKFVTGDCTFRGITISDNDYLYFTGDYKENNNYTLAFVKSNIPRFINNSQLMKFFIEQFKYLLEDNHEQI